MNQGGLLDTQNSSSLLAAAVAARPLALTIVPSWLLCSWLKPSALLVKKTAAGQQLRAINADFQYFLASLRCLQSIFLEKRQTIRVFVVEKANLEK